MMRFVLTIAALLSTALPALADVKIQEITTPGGTHVWLQEDHSIPFVALELRFRGGVSLEPADKAGATNLMVGLLEEGAGDLNARAFARRLEELAASFGYRAYDDAISISARFLTENQDQSLALLRDSLIAPRFDADAVERVRGQVLSGLKSDETDPDSIAGRAFDKLVYGAHPYGRGRQGTIETVAALTRDDLIKVFKGAFARDRVYVSLVGDITPAQAAKTVDALLADMPEVGAPMAGPAALNLTKGITVVDFDTPQSVVMFAQPGIKRDDPDFFAAFVLDLILGGGSFESRLMHEVREKRGLTYGINTYLLAKDQAQLWAGSVASANEKVAETISVIRDEWQKLRDNGVSEAELRDAKTYLTGSYPLRFDGNGTIANILVGMQMQGWPADYIATRNDRVNAVTLDDVNRVAIRLLDPEALRFVVVGKPVGLDGVSN
jgi:zinc protease